ncbi:MAG: nucleotidyltransferase domain-containing protein [Caldilineaceae bacterium]|nr:nucleotidyltransferase domain-containing protein [Caldilineaceae bacterium]
MELQTEYLHKLQAALEAAPTIKAAWLTGSFGRGNADRYSDIDLNLWLDAVDLEGFRQGTETWLNELRPLVLFTWMFNDRMANCLTVDGLRLDLWLHSDGMPQLDESRVQVLLDRENALQFGASVAEPDAAALKKRLAQQIREFWRCIALTPAVIGRDERIVSLMGLTVESNILTDVLISGYGIPRDSGVKRLNPFLPEGLRAEIEQALAFDGLSLSSLVQAHLALARIMQAQGRQLATRHDFAYPAEVERAALAYVMRELGAMDVVGLVESEEQQ